VNGRTAAVTLLIPSSNPVKLVGRAKQGDGSYINGGTVRLYTASTVFNAVDIYNLPPPLITLTTTYGGYFDFSDQNVGQYVLTLQTGNGTTIGSAFWLRSGESTHSETIIENPGRTDLLNRLLGLKESIRYRILDRQTDWMVEVADNVDADIDATPDLVDWCLFVGNIASGTAANFGQAWAAGLSSSHFGSIASSVTVGSLKQQGLTTTSIIAAEKASSIQNQTLTIKGALAQPYFAYGSSASTEIGEFDTIFTEDVKRLIDPNLTAPFLDVKFSRNKPIHRHSKEWFQALDVYDFSERWLTTYYEQAVTGMPSLPTQFSTARARRIVDAAEGQLRALEAGTGQLFIGPDPFEVSSTTATHEPLPLNLEDYYTKYKVSETKKDVLDWVKKGSSVVSIGGHTVAAGTAAGIVTAPGAAVAEVVALSANGVNFGASVIQATIKADMASTYMQMGTKYCANMVTAPLALKRTEDFIVSEATNPYYLDSNNSFEGQINSISLGGLKIGNREVFFPVQLSLLPFYPPIQFTSEKQATINFQNSIGKDTAVFRIETKVRDFTGVHDHVVTAGGQLQGGQGKTTYTPFHGNLTANGLLSAGTVETRLWTGPFQATRATTHNFYVIPINIGFSLLGPFSKQQEEEVKIAMKEPLSFVRSQNEAMSGEDLLAAADHVRERVETNLVVGANTFTRDYSFSTNIFEGEFRLYRPVGADVAFRIEMNGQYIGWDESAGTTHLGFPGEYSGNDANPETIAVPNIGGQTVTVHVALADVETEAVSVLLEVWEQPIRSAVLAVLPDQVSSLSRTGVMHVVELAIGESSHQHPLEAVTFSATPLRSAIGTELNWADISWSGTTNIPAAGLKTCSMELDTSGVADGIYTGKVTVTSANAGVLTVPVSITVDGKAPLVSVEPIREWWTNPTGPVVSWIGEDNVTVQSNLVYSFILDPLDGDWSGYIQTTNRDLSAISDGSYLLSVLSRDQALNETETPADTVIVIDRSGNLWKQRIVDADLEDAITDISQVSWRGDFDSDGVNNLMEYRAGTNPANPGDLFAFDGSSASPDGLVIQWNAKRGITYQVKRTTNLVYGTWIDAPSGIVYNEKSQKKAQINGILEYRDNSVIQGAVYYKVEIKD
jgi:hypothetical protein